MNVHNMTNPTTGRSSLNQFIINDGVDSYFQSYESIIVKLDGSSCPVKVILDINHWNHSTTTGKYRNIFLGETIKETRAKIASGAYILADLN